MGNMAPNGLWILELKIPHIFLFGEKPNIKRTMYYIKDRTGVFEDYFPCRKINCKLKHVLNWLNLFVTYHNKEVINA
jgi:putative transposase